MRGDKIVKMSVTLYVNDPKDFIGRNLMSSLDRLSQDKKCGISDQHFEGDLRLPTG